MSVAPVDIMSPNRQNDGSSRPADARPGRFFDFACVPVEMVVEFHDSDELLICVDEVSICLSDEQAERLSDLIWKKRQQREEQRKGY